ncbi:MAG TPA: hypothetical protein VNA28_03470 [Solirubrobacteraceae bacterium]|nr:hypothetical protein [Solirubrobacteraceae bacterium]
MAIEGKVVLWENLRDLAGLAERLLDVDFDRLIDRAHGQRAELEPFRMRAGRAVLSAATVPAGGYRRAAFSRGSGPW